MNAMYEMSQGIHIFSVIFMLIALMWVLLLHKGNAPQETFVTRVAIASLLYVSFLGGVTLTGTVMMAAKHLSFSFANIVMILGLISIIALEVRRNKLLKLVTKFRSVKLDIYKPVGFNYVIIELVLILLVSAIAVIAA
jgi:predicted ATPase